MANTILTPTAVTREALRILHQKLNFIGTINRQYDDSFAKSGAKIGDSLKIRLPNQYTVRTGATLNVQDTTESSVTLQVATQKGVDVNFSSVELTMDLDDFSSRILEPAMSVLAANIEDDAIDMYKDVYNQANNLGSSATYAKMVEVDRKLFENLTPMDNRSMNLDGQTHADLLDAFKALFHEGREISKQYKEAFIGRAAGFDFYRNTLLPLHTTGDENGDSSTITINGADQTGASVTVANGSSKTLKEGDIITLAGSNRVHPETKESTGTLQQFVVTEDVSAGGTTVNISPSIVTSGATQNVSASPTDSGAVTKVGGASATYPVSMGYHRDAFTFATADLVMPQGVDFASRQVMDGISMRIVRQYDINNDAFPCRIDVLYGYKTIRPELACRWANNS